MTPTPVPRPTAGTCPVARVAVDVPLSHLDRPFDYLVAAADDGVAQPGVRVRVRFAGRRVTGYILERVETSDHGGQLATIHAVVSPEPVLTPEIAGLCRAVADRYAGTMADVLRLAIPPRRAKVEQEQMPQTDPAHDDARSSSASAQAPNGHGVIPDGPIDETGADSTGWVRYPDGPAFLAALRDGRAPRAVWQALPGEDWPARLADAAAETVAGGRGALIVAADARDVARIDAALAARLHPDAHVALTSDLGPTRRYRAFIAALRGRARVVVGTRAAAFAPVRQLGLVAIFDDGDDVHADPHAPYPHPRDVLMLRAQRENAALVIGGLARTAEGHVLVRRGWAHSLVAARDVVRRAMPRIEAAGDGRAVGADSAAARARIPPVAFAAARAALDADAPVLVQVPRRGYLPSLACGDCRRAARCRRCHGPMGLRGASSMPVCRWCGVAAPRWTCPACAATRLRATVTGSARTAEEIGRAFPGVLLRTSSADRAGGGKTLGEVPGGAAIVIATPGAEPIADGGYGAVLLLDGALLLGRADLRAAEETLRRWMAAATLARPAGDGGRVVIGADASIPTVQALIRWDPVGHAEAELDARVELNFPPSATMASVQGSEVAVAAAVGEAALPDGTDELGPVPVEVSSAMPIEGADESGPTVRTLLRVPAPRRRELTAALQALAAARSARKESSSIRVEVDPTELG